MWFQETGSKMGLDDITTHISMQSQQTNVQFYQQSHELLKFSGVFTLTDNYFPHF